MRPCTPARPYPRTSQRPARRLPNAPIDPAGRSRRLSRFPTALRLAHLGRSQLRRWRSIHHPVSNMATSLDRVRRLRGLRSILAGVRRAALRASCDAASWDGRLGVLGRATGCRATARWRAGRSRNEKATTSTPCRVTGAGHHGTPVMGGGVMGRGAGRRAIYLSSRPMTGCVVGRAIGRLGTGDRVSGGGAMAGRSRGRGRAR